MLIQSHTLLHLEHVAVHSLTQLLSDYYREGSSKHGDGVFTIMCIFAVAATKCLSGFAEFYTIAKIFQELWMHLYLFG